MLLGYLRRQKFCDPFTKMFREEIAFCILCVYGKHFAKTFSWWVGFDFSVEQTQNVCSFINHLKCTKWRIMRKLFTVLTNNIILIIITVYLVYLKVAKIIFGTSQICVRFNADCRDCSREFQKLFAACLTISFKRTESCSYVWICLMAQLLHRYLDAGLLTTTQTQTETQRQIQ